MLRRLFACRRRLQCVKERVFDVLKFSRCDSLPDEILEFRLLDFYDHYGEFLKMSLWRRT